MTSQTWLSERIALNLARIAAGGDQVPAALEQFQQDVILFSGNHEALLEGDSAIGVNRVTNSTARAALTAVLWVLGAFNVLTAAAIAAVVFTFRVVAWRRSWH